MAEKEIYNLRPVQNNNCIKRCNKEDRKSTTEDGICLVTSSVIDGEKIRCVGIWEYNKIHWLSRYCSIFARGMRKKWPINYIEICSGPGRCITRENGQEIDGTSLAIINHEFFNYFDKAFFVDNNSDSIDALNKRTKDLGKNNVAEALIGDYNDINGIKKILSSIPKNCLNLVFIDPTDCSIPFDLIKAISSILITADFIINIAIFTDLNRNIKQAILDTNYKKAKEKYIRFLGNDDYFLNKNVIDAANENDNSRMRSLFIKEYKRSLGNIGYMYTDTEKVEHYYNLLFATKHNRGLDFWHKMKKLEPSGQSRIDF